MPPGGAPGCRVEGHSAAPLKDSPSRTNPSGEPPSPPPPAPKRKLSTLAKAWNEICTSLPAVKETTRDRERKEAIRLKERPIEEWRAVFRSVEASPFCCGQNDRAWRATFDWIISNPSNAIKVLEGKYDPPPEELPPKTAPPHPERVTQRIERALPASQDAVDQERWRLIREALRRRIDPGNFETWLKPCYLHQILAREAQVAAPAEVFVEWLTENLNSSLEQALAEAGVGVARVKFILASQTQEAP